MIEEFGLVVGLSGRLAEIEPQRRSSCDHCGAKGACGTSLIDRFLGRRPLRLWVDNTIGAVVGERVILGVQDAVLLRASAAAYLAPLAGLILGATLSLQIATRLGWPGADTWSLIGGILGLAGAFRWVAHYSRRLRTDPAYQAVLLGRALSNDKECVVTFNPDR